MTNNSRLLPDSLPRQIHLHGQQQGDATALISEAENQTWADYARLVNRIANRLLSLDIAKGDHIALLGRNTLPYAQMMGGILTAGAAIVPLPTMLSPASLLTVIRDCKPRLLFVDRYLRDKVEAMQTLAGGDIGVTLIALDFHDQTLPLLQDWLHDASDAPPDVDLFESDTFCVMYSSGTTGKPKGIVLSHGSRTRQASTMALLDFNTEAVNIISTPLYSLGALSTWMPTIYGGGCNILMPRFNDLQYLKLLRQHRVTHLILVPVQYERLLDHPEFDSFDLSSVKFKFGGSAPMSESRKQELARRFPGEMFEFYSLTEGGVTTALLVNHYPDKLASVGQAANGCVIKIIDDEGKALGPGETGEVVGRSAVHMTGYLNSPATDTPLHWHDEDGLQYIRSGDLGYLDPDGFLFLRDRKKDMIISGGMNIYATDIEAVLQRYPDLAQVAVVGVPSQRWGETPVAFVVLAPGASANEEHLLTWSNQHLGKHQRLSNIHIVADLPRNHLGKVLKKQLKQELLASADSCA